MNINNQFILSIAIPTWNRASFLQENVEQIIAEITQNDYRSIEIFVSDNASCDTTEDYCLALAQRYDFFHYQRNLTNLGANANFQNAIQLSQGEYVWLLGDDDLIIPGSLKKIIQDINRYQQAAIIIGGCLNDETNERLYPPFIETALLTNKNIIEQYDAIKLAGKISVLIFKRSTIVAILPIAWQIITELTTPWPHLVWVLLILNTDQTILFLPYCTNYFLEKNRYNMLQDGISRTNIMIASYGALIELCFKKKLLDENFYQLLKNSITKNRQAELLKIVAYASYMNPYWATVKNSCSVLRQLPGIKNKINFFVVYFLPITLPTTLRKFFFQLPLIFFPQWKKYNAFIKYLEKASVLLKEKNARNKFDQKGL